MIKYKNKYNWNTFMINGTLVKINRLVQEKPPTSVVEMIDKGVFGLQAIDTGWEFKKIRVTPFKSKMKAMLQFQEFLKHPKVSNDSYQYGMMLHGSSHIEHVREITLIFQEESKSITQQLIANPLWSGINGTKRLLSGYGLNVECTPAMQSQLFAMLDASNKDGKWMASFGLKDHQQKAVYRWQDEFFPKINNMSPHEMQNLSANVCNVARLPHIPIHFKEAGKSCMFSISLDGGKVITVEKEEDGLGTWGWLTEPDKDDFQTIGELDQGNRIKISAMKLDMVMSWAMNNHILLHELAHYIQFVHPTAYRLNRGEYRLNYDQYEEIFAGHGAAYMSTFARILIDFGFYKEEAIYDSLEDNGICYFPIRSIRLKDLDEGITQYCKKFE